VGVVPINRNRVTSHGNAWCFGWEISTITNEETTLCYIITNKNNKLLVIMEQSECINLQRGPKVASFVERSARGWCTRHLRRIRGCDARIRRESGA
jgi:hypothetical protein